MYNSHSWSPFCVTSSPSTVQKYLLTVCIHGIILLIETLHNAVSYRVHSFKVDLAVKDLYIGIVLRLSITLKIY